jgi:hypothetical protein
MDLNEERIKRYGILFVPSYVLGGAIFTLYTSVKQFMAYRNFPPLVSLATSLAETLLFNIELGIAVLVLSFLLGRYSEKFNWLLSGVMIGLSLHLFTVGKWMLSGASGPEISTYGAILGTGLAFPVILGVAGQIVQRIWHPEINSFSSE